MQPSMNTKSSKLNGKFKNTLGTIRDVVENQPNLKEGLEDVVDTEKQIFDMGMEQVTNLTKYVKANWKTVVPALAALGVSAYLLRGRSKK